MKNKIGRFKKTKHCKKRQKERFIDDLRLKKIIKSGRTGEIESGIISYQDEECLALISDEDDVIITVARHSEKLPKPKMLQRDQGQEIIELIKNEKPIDKPKLEQPKCKKKTEKTESDEISFEDYLSGKFNFAKK